MILGKTMFLGENKLYFYLNFKWTKKSSPKVL